MKSEINKNLDDFSLEVKRVFAAPLNLVWRAWTEANLLDQWWAPRPWRCETSFMDFRPGGRWDYTMVGPEGERHAAVQLFDQIEVEEFYLGKDAFADEAGNILENLPVATWKNTFMPTEHGTLVITWAHYPSREALETVLNMGMEQGLQMAQNNLDELLDKMR